MTVTEKKGNESDDDVPEFLGIKHGGRKTRSAIPRMKITVEDTEKGEIRCPHPDCMKQQFGILVADSGCKKITCANHKPHYFSFCVHCKTQNAECDCVDSCAVVFRRSQKKKLDARKQK